MRMRKDMIVATLILVGGLGWPLSVAAQGFRDRILERAPRLDAPLVNSGERYVVVHLSENRVFVFEGTRTIWSAQAGTGDRVQA